MCRYTCASTTVKYTREFTEYYTKINVLLKSGFSFKTISPYSVNYKNRNKDMETLKTQLDMFELHI